MAATESLSKIASRAEVDIGTTTTGAVRTANVNMPAISPTGYTPDLLANVAELLSPILANSIVNLVTIKTYELSID